MTVDLALTKLATMLLLYFYLIGYVSGIIEFRGDSVEDFLNELPGVFRQLQQDPLVIGVDRSHYLYLIGTEYLRTLGLLTRRVHMQLNGELQEFRASDVDELYSALHSLHSQLGDLVDIHSGSVNDDPFLGTNEQGELPIHNNENFQFHCIPERNGSRGRPRLTIPLEQLIALEEFGFSYTQCASMLGISTQTLQNRRRELNLPLGINRFSNISDHLLDTEVTAILHITPDAGERYVIGALRARGFHLQRSRIRDAILRIDPIGRACRRRRTLFRRQYNVPGPNALWYAFLYIYIYTYIIRNLVRNAKVNWALAQCCKIFSLYSINNFFGTVLTIVIIFFEICASFNSNPDLSPGQPGGQPKFLA